MSRTKTIHTGLVVAAVAVGSLIPLANAANAHEWRGTHGAYSQRINPWNGGRGNADRYEYRNDSGDYGYHRQHRDNVGGAVAVGIFATVLGLALAAESDRVQHRYYDADND